MKSINVAIIGRWGFHATDFVERNRQIPGCNMVAAWDCDPVEGKKWANRLGLDFEADYETLLKNPQIDAVIITSATVDHARMSSLAARAGKAVMVEKAPMLTGRSARDVKEAIEQSGILYVFSDPILRREALQLKKMADDGAFGQITMMHIRNAHAKALDGSLPDRFFCKEETGGGVTMDIGCHGIHMLWWFLGKPVKCVSLHGHLTERSKAGGVEDNSVAAYLFENGAIGIAQSSWTALGDQGGIDLYGTRGCARVFGGRLHYCLEDKQWHTIEKDEMPPEGMKPMNMWLDTLINGVEHGEYHVEEAVELAQMLEAESEAWKKVK